MPGWLHLRWSLKLSSAAHLAAALKEQTEALKEALSARTGSNSITTVKTDLGWPTLTDDKSDTKDVVLFYEEFEDVCALANNCRGMSAREKLLALRARCKGSRAKTYTNAYRAAWKTGEVVDDPEAVYLRIKNKHLMFGESREEREVRIDGEHQALVKGQLSGHQFEPLFEASVADLESVGLEKTPRELYLSYLRKCLRTCRRRSGRTSGSDRETPRKWVSGPLPRGRSPTRWSSSTSSEKRLTERWRTRRTRDHGNCPKGDSCPFSHDKELRKQALAAKRGESTLAAKGGKGGGKGGAKAAAKAKPKAKPKAAAKSTAKPPGTICPFFQKTGSCRKGANCDMVHRLLAGQGQALPANWGPPSRASMSNPFAAFSIQIGSAGVQAGLPAADPKLSKGRERPFLGARRAARRLVVAGRERARRLPVPDGGPGTGSPRRVHARRVRRSEPCHRGALGRHA